MKAVTMQVGDQVADTILEITPAIAKWLKNLGFAGVIRYITSLKKSELDACFAEGLKVGLVTYAGAYSPTSAILAAHTLGIPEGVHIALDVEGVDMDPLLLIEDIKNWATKIKLAMYKPAQYVGSKQLLTSKELYSTPIELYWHSCSRVIDRFGNEAAPSCGWSMIQLYPPNISISPGVRIDRNIVQQDYAGRLPIFVGAD